MERTSVEEIMDSNFLKIGAEERVSKLFGLLSSAKKHHAVVFDSNGEYVGITSTREMLRRQADFSQMKVRSITDENRPRLTRDMSLMKAAELMYVSDSRILPVIEENKVFGVVSANAIIKQAAERSPIASKRARDIASKNPVVLKQTESIGKAITLMRDKNIKRVLVSDKKGNIVGILSLQELIEKHLVHATSERLPFVSGARGHSSERATALKMPISSEMSSFFITVKPDQRVGALLSDIEGGRAIVLVEKGKAVGIITRRDLLEAIVKTGAVERNIQVANVPALDEIDKAKVDSTINASYDRVKKTLGMPYFLLVHFKQHKEAGARVKHSVHIRASAPGMNFKAEATSWNVITSLQDALSEIEREIRKAIGKKRKSFRKARAK
ncbi:MAG: CBS domain-containing protein [Candidatus Diapherotrites archaeon]